MLNKKRLKKIIRSPSRREREGKGLDRICFAVHMDLISLGPYSPRNNRGVIN
jgi:hypothetical protein